MRILRGIAILLCLSSTACNLLFQKVGSNSPSPAAPFVFDWKASFSVAGATQFLQVLTSSTSKGSTEAATWSNPPLGATYTFDGIILAPNGYLYTTPYNWVTAMLKIDPVTFVPTVIGNLASGGLWPGGVLAMNAHIYAMPENCGSGILDINTNNDTFQVIPTPAIAIHIFGACYHSTVLGVNGKVYGIPASADQIMELDPTTGDIQFVGPNFYTDPTYQMLTGWRWCRAITAPNGKIYSLGTFGVSPTLEFDPITGATRFYPTYAGEHCGAVLGPDGKIYSFPDSTTDVTEFDPETGIQHTYDTGVVHGGYTGVLAPNGKIYSPGGTGKLLEFDTATKAFQYLSDPDPSHVAFYAEGGILTPQGKIVYASFATNSLLVIDPHAAKNFPENVALSPWLNSTH